MSEYGTPWPLVILYGLFVVLLIVLVVGFAGLLVSIGTQETQQGTVIAITPDTQITFSRITFQVNDNGYTFTESISCTGNFQFEDGQTVSITSEDSWFTFWRSYSLNDLPAGCKALNSIN